MWMNICVFPSVWLGVQISCLQDHRQQWVLLRIRRKWMLWHPSLFWRGVGLPLPAHKRSLISFFLFTLFIPSYSTLIVISSFSWGRSQMPFSFCSMNKSASFIFRRTLKMFLWRNSSYFLHHVLSFPLPPILPIPPCAFSSLSFPVAYRLCSSFSFRCFIVNIESHYMVVFRVQKRLLFLTWNPRIWNWYRCTEHLWNRCQNF